MRNIAIAIDGPAAAGKSTVAKIVAKKLGFTYIDTGAMYRAVTLYVLKKGLDPQNEKESCSLIPEINIVLDAFDRVFLNGEDVTKEIRSREVASNVSYIASYKEIRLFLVEQQRIMASNTSVVMDGRDIGSYVLPNADVKIFQIASVQTRAQRRYDENLSKGIECSYQDIEEEVRKRDYIDSHRDFAPLKKAEDAIELDTSFLSIEQVVSEILKIIEERLGDMQCH